MRVIRLASMVSLVFLGSLNAGGTKPNIEVKNTAKLNYSVAGTAQTALEATDSGFKVDRKIDLTVANTDGSKSIDVTPNTTAQVLTYTIENTGNDTDTYGLSVVHADGSNGADDDYDSTGCKIFDGASEITAIELASGAQKTITVKCDIPPAGDPTVKDNQNSKVWLLATINGRTKANDDADDPLAVQDVFADGASAESLTSDIAFDGKHSDMGTYHVATASLTIQKTSMVLSDPVTDSSGATEAHRIPGAKMRYCFKVDNAGSSDAEGVHVKDSISTDMTYLNSGKILQDSGTACVCEDISDTSGSISDNDVDIDLGTVTKSATTSTARACAYIEATIN